MTLTEHKDLCTNDLHVRVTLAATEIHQAQFSLKEAILRRIVDEMVRELLPVMRAHIHIDWAVVSARIQDAIIQRVVDTLQSGA